jgi:hypothetical protein
MNEIAIRNILHYMAVERHGKDISPLPDGRDFVKEDYIKGYIYTYELTNRSSACVVATTDKTTYDELYNDRENSVILI